MAKPLGPSLTRKSFLRLLAGAGAAAVASGPAAAKHPARARPQAMRTRVIPKSAEALPVVGLGTWQTFDVGPDADVLAARGAVLRALFDGGGRVIDSSPMYGRSEAVIGRLLDEMGARDKAFLATKVWTRGKENGVRQMQASLAKLRTPVIDLMQVHNLVAWQAHLETLRAWKEKGLVRYIGITHYTTAALDDLARIIAREPLDFVQMAYSINVRAAENRLLPTAEERGVAVLVNRPFEGGSAFGAVRGRPLPGWAADFDCASWGQFFLKFVLGHAAVTCVIPGTAKIRHMVDNVAAGRGRLPDAAERRRMVSYMQAL